MNGKVVLISDAASASGLALARAYAGVGAKLALNCAGGEAPDIAGAAVYRADLTKGAEAEALAESVVNTFGRLDAVIHNHNAVDHLSIERADDGQVRAALQYNAKSAFLLTRACGDYMRKRGGGAIVYVSSIHGEKPTGSAFAYSAAKAAVAMLAKETAIDFGAYGVRANVIAVGPVAGHDGVFKSGLSGLYDHMEQKIPGKRPVTWEEAAKLALFLTGGDCPALNGECIKLDGGFLLFYGHRYNYEEWRDLSQEKKESRGGLW
ncbi:MAG: SDR family oxidoreductase [Oscillospiraceae bacterium]|nr:SDR family oxidoreductase [Oscillospiraceae bacterium]